MLVEHLCRRHGVKRHADGDRIISVQANLCRHLIPFLVKSRTRTFEGAAGPASSNVIDIAHLKVDLGAYANADLSASWQAR